MGINFLLWSIALGQGVKILRQKRVNSHEIQETFYGEDSEMLEQVTQKDDGCIPGNTQGCSEHPGLVEAGLAYCREGWTA